MIVLPVNATDSEILTAVRQWVAALAAGDYRRAYDLTDHDPYFRWTPDLLRDVIAGYGLPEPAPDGIIHRITPIDTAQGESNPEHSVVRWEHPRDHGDGRLTIGEVWYDLPLDGTWSDLTATFEIQRATDGVRLALQEIKVF